MDKQKLDEYKNVLEKEREDCLSGLGNEEQPDNFGSDVDMDEEADEAESMGEKIATNQTSKERIEEIEEALRKIADGKYGVCEKCGSEIGNDVLSASPASRLCKNCKLNK